jgi:hypothetical protein
MRGNYILVDGEPVAVPDLMTWATNFEDSMKRVAWTDVRGVRVSTVFLGVDHSWGDGPPVLFETMIFGSEAGDLDEYQERYTTLEDARLGHERAVAMVRAIPAWMIYARRFASKVARAISKAVRR